MYVIVVFKLKKGILSVIKLIIMNHEDLLTQFCNEFYVESTQARFFLESTNWNYELAAALLREVFPPEQEEGFEGSDRATTPDTNAALPSASERPNPPSNPAVNSKGKKVSQKKFATLKDLQEDEEDPDEKSNLFTGGEKSGLSVQGPDPKKQLVRDIIEKAHQQTASTGTERETSPPAPVPAFSGSGQRLGTEDELARPTKQSEGTPFTQATVPQPRNEPERNLGTPVRRTLYFWRNGFSVDDGLLYSYDDPANQETLRLINNGRAPLHLLGVTMNQPIDVVVQHRLDEDYRAPTKPFSGKGQRLGSTYAPQQAQIPGAFHDQASSQSSEPAKKVQVDESQPSTRIQVRLTNGSRTVITLNLSHTVHDLYEAVRVSSPGSFILCVPFPAKTLEDDPSVTIEQASLQNASLVQKQQ
ncbi:UB Xdomain protein Ubx3 [Schizosaccharomyces cryophilus OY26]|uniref:UB Xdomain protein Ubx3 n=1 Tax=Schizosaccharomyces cryophilus (strain OY26 / ATCC MYA-4695 / CBS 11777 / NBRC 106824 / NRRL Y48691) TaxID=653667 RepID=S9VUB9_SCHCR|nr:UB Xdomain protein Ubx3 [Schizosaccharomyces cryophilus OY26]EPY49705.1 UB Xdomain protein Ubx3 [Schizosaccharomyces cryophilus OY26]